MNAVYLLKASCPYHHTAAGDAEAYGLSTLLATYTGVASVVVLSEVLDYLQE